MEDRQQRFADEYLIDLNATNAAIRAGYSQKTADSQGSRLLKNVKVADYIKKKLAERSAKCAVNADFVLEKLKKVIERSLQEKPVMRFNPVTKKMEPTGEYMYDSLGVTKACELLGKHLKMFTDKTEISGDVVFEIKDPFKVEE